MVHHFGDTADGEDPCGICDNCAPKECDAQRFRAATATEKAAALRVAAELHGAGTRSTGRLYSELFPRKEISRNEFEDLLGGMARAGLLRLDDAVFDKGGRQIPYRTAQLTREGRALDGRTPLELVVKDREPVLPPPKRRKKGRASASQRSEGYGRPLTSLVSTPTPAADSGKRMSVPHDAELDIELEEALRAWRLAEARRLGIPAFRIFTDRAMSGLVKLRPSNSSQMLSVPGIGLRIAEKYGREICRILQSHNPE